MSHLAFRRLAGAALMIAFACAPPASAQLRAFPGAEGHGALATGGRGGEVYIVTNRNDSGAGSFREAFNYSGTTPRTIVFETGGTITLNSRLTLNSKANITIAGHTALGGGILIKGDAFSINDSSNLVIRHMRFRYNNPDADRDAVSVSNGQNMIFDHVSVSWGRDECLSLTNASTNITVQNSIIAEGTRDDHQYGSLISSTGPDERITLWRNLYINQLGRTPRAASQAGEDFVLDMVNNVIYNWGADGDWGSESCVSDNERATWNQINNYYIAGPNTTKNFIEDLLNRYSSTILRGGSGTDAAYLSGNMVDSDRDGTLDGAAAGWSNTQGGITQLSSPRAIETYAQISQPQSASDALATVIDDAGCMPWNRDSVDAGLIEDLESYGSEGSIRTSIPSFPSIATGTAPTDSDRDGMPDSWEDWYGSNANLKNPNVAAPDGYTALEKYLQWLIDPETVEGGFTVGSVGSAQGARTNEPGPLSFTWSGFESAASGIVGYNIRFGIPGDPDLYLDFDTGASTSVTINPLDIPDFGVEFPDGTYRCTIRAINANGGKSTAAGANVTVDTTPPQLTLSTEAPDPVDVPFIITLQANELIEGVGSDDLVLENATGELQGEKAGDVFSFLITPLTPGSVSVGFNATGVHDLATNAASPVSPLTRTYAPLVAEGEGEAAFEGSVDGEGVVEGINEGEGTTEGETGVEGEGATEGLVEGLLEGEGIEEGEEPPACDDNLLLDPGFEAGNLATHWGTNMTGLPSLMLYQAGEASVSPASGDYALLFYPRVTADVLAVGQQVQVEAGRPLQLSFDLLVSASATGNISIHLGGIPVATIALATITSREYERMEFEIPALDASGTVTLNLGNGSLASIGGAFMDDFCITYIGDAEGATDGEGLADGEGGGEGQTEAEADGEGDDEGQPEGIIDGELPIEGEGEGSIDGEDPSEGECVVGEGEGNACCHLAEDPCACLLDAHNDENALCPNLEWEQASTFTLQDDATETPFAEFEVWTRGECDAWPDEKGFLNPGTDVFVCTRMLIPGVPSLTYNDAPADVELSIAGDYVYFSGREWIAYDSCGGVYDEITFRCWLLSSGTRFTLVANEQSYSSTMADTPPNCQFRKCEEDFPQAFDINGNFQCELSELLRVIQFYNATVFGCAIDTEDGFAPGAAEHDCIPYTADYNPQDWILSLSELLRVIQIFNAGGYFECPGAGEDGFCLT